MPVAIAAVAAASLIRTHMTRPRCRHSHTHGESWLGQALPLAPHPLGKNSLSPATQGPKAVEAFHHGLKGGPLNHP